MSDRGFVRREGLRRLLLFHSWQNANNLMLILNCVDVHLMQELMHHGKIWHLARTMLAKDLEQQE